MARTNAAGQRAKPQRRRRHVVQHACGTNWNNNLREIASLLPISDTMHGRGLTKKETLVHMLWYFEFLQTHIENLQARLPPGCLPVNETESESESEDSIVSEPESPPPPLQAKRKRQRLCARSQRGSELPAGSWISIKSELDNDEIKVEFLPEEDDQPAPMWQSGHNWTEPVSDDSDSVSTSSPDSVCSLSLLQAGSVVNGGHCSACDGRTSSEDGSPEQLQFTPPTGSALMSLREHRSDVFEQGDEGESICSAGSTPLMPKMPLFGTGLTLNLSPSLLTSPTRGVCHELLPQGQEDLQTLFEDVWVNSEANVSKIASLQSSQSNDSAPDWSGRRGRKLSVALTSSQSDEDEVGQDDITWTPQLMKVRHRRKPRAKVPPKAVPDAKKKCVNGFIMFCRINRKLYLQSRPATPSTVVTKALANIWHHLPKQERRIYCLKARRYSCQENRNVRVQEEEDDSGEECVPSPLHLLLADRRLCAAARGEPEP
ncbi:meiosis initiator protein-like [Alosa sapidissima]|uniref:meiosis initiator protein-like n=1 Tax=Alosa sapidissima TaxID=34773 RepID=UPI001C08EDC8|nr:meiosis initiator protein-like [Alosa sapidissima]